MPEGGELVFVSCPLPHPSYLNLFLLPCLLWRSLGEPLTYWLQSMLEEDPSLGQCSSLVRVYLAVAPLGGQECLRSQSSSPGMGFQGDGHDADLL